jgi:hypothetical protein
MNTKSQKEAKEYKEPAMEDTRPKIMTKPLPQILDELEDYIRRVEDAVKQAQAAAKESREAAAQAKASGEEAAAAAKKAAEVAVAKVREEAAKAIDAMGIRVSGLESELNALKEKVREEALAVNRAFLAAKDKHTEGSPSLKK